MPEHKIAYKPLVSTEELLGPRNVLQARDYSLADYSYEIIIKQIKAFEEKLDNEHEVAVQLASFGQRHNVCNGYWIRKSKYIALSRICRGTTRPVDTKSFAA